MKIAEVMEQTGLSKKAIRLYIESNFIHPIYGENGYRIFTHEDCQKLTTIKKLRDLGFSLKQITLLLETPQIAPFVMCLHKFHLKTQYECLQEQLNTTDRLFNTLIGTPAVQLEEQLHTTYCSEQKQDDDRPISETDAELMLSSFFIIFPIDSSLNEYQLFLWERLKKAYMEDSSVSLKKFRNYLCNKSQEEQFLTEFIQNSIYAKSIYQAISHLTKEELIAFTQKCCANIKKHISDSAWKQNWIYYKKNICQGLYAAYNEKISATMSQFSVLFANYHRNMTSIVELFTQYCTSESGKEFYDLLQHYLQDYFDIDSFDDVILLILLSYD